jgi:hypothetical protein
MGPALVRGLVYRVAQSMVEEPMAAFSPEEGIKQAAPGACADAVAQVANAPEETVFLIREQSGIIAELGRAPAVHVRAGLIVESGVLLLPVLIKVSGELYETWMNYHAEVCPPALACLALQEQIGLHFFDDRSVRARVIAVPNQLQAFWRDTLRTLAQAPPWSMAAFDAARDRVYASYPTVPDLWHALRTAPMSP